MAEYSNSCGKTPLIAVVGPTASGKTAFAVEIAKRFDGEVISMDSMQIYKRLCIGTAKPSPEEMQGIKHHMIDVVEPDEPFNANDYASIARRTVNDIYLRGKMPVLCGGTGLYLNSLLYSYNMSEASFDDSLRKQLYDDAEKYGADFLYAKLQKVDPVSAEQIHPNNVKRVVRALEIYMLTGKPKSEQVTAERERVFDALIFRMEWDRDILYDRINRRVDVMLENGLEKEVRELISAGVLKLRGDASQAGQAIGYKEMLEYIDGKISYDDAVEKIKMNSRRYAKRQITWFKRTENIKWMNPCDDGAVSEAFDIIENFVKRY